MKLRNQLITNARAAMRLWAKRWRECAALHDRAGAKVALERALIWRETANNQAILASLANV